MEPTDFVIECPHCFTPVLIEKINCAIFRHGTLKSNGQQIDPHALHLFTFQTPIFTALKK